MSDDKLIDFKLEIINREIEELKADAREDRKVVTQAVQTMSENIVKLTIMQEQQQKEMNIIREDVKENNSKTTSQLFDLIKTFWGKFVIALVVLSLATMGIKTGVDVVKLLAK